MPRWCWLAVVALFSCWLSAGCGCGDGPVRVRGTVRYNGEPLTSGQVMFIPTALDEGHSARGSIGKDGSSELTTFQPARGLNSSKAPSPAGHFRPDSQEVLDFLGGGKKTVVNALDLC